VRQGVRVLGQGLRRQLLDSQGVCVAAGAEEGPCPRCVTPMAVEKTRVRHVVTLALGAVSVRETVRVCRYRGGCRHEDGSRVRRRAAILEALVPPGGVFGYDVMVHVGLERFLRHRQGEEVREALAREHGVTLSVSEVSTLARRFLVSLRALHEACSPALAQVLRGDGGWPLHVDGSCEGGRGTLLVAFAGWRRWALDAWKAPTERADAILPRLHAVADRFGNPCAVMRDLGRAVTQAVDDLVAQRGLDVPVLACHLHFLADLGSDILAAGHDALREAFRAWKLRPALRQLARDVGRRLGAHVGEGRKALLLWQQDHDAGHRLPEGRDGLAVVRGLAQWVLDYPADSTCRSFPFDRCWLDLYRRSRLARRAANAFRRTPPHDRHVRSALDRLCRALDPVATDPTSARVAEALQERAALFDELRDVLRVLPRPPQRRDHTTRKTHLATQDALAELRDVRSGLERWLRELLERRAEHGLGQNLRDAIDEILAHVERHGASLWGHAVTLSTEAGGGVRLVDRTNNIEETFFRDLKHGERRRSGRKALSQDFETLPPEVALVQNLTHPDYVAVVCGSLENLPSALARLDARHRDATRSGHAANPAERPPPLVVESASLPVADRRVVRTEAMDRRVRKAAASRAPHTAKRVA